MVQRETALVQKPYLNGGCGRIILPGPRPAHHGLVDESIFMYPLWVNADRNPQPGVDCVTDLFQLPWPFETDSFDGALFGHFMEHVPHEIRLRDDSPRAKELAQMQDGWYAIWSEVHRVCTPGAIVHVLSPYGWSQGASVDPTHTRLIFEHTFTHSMAPDPTSPFEYQTGGLHFEMEGPAVFHITEMFQHLRDDPAEFTRALQTRLNVVYELYVKLRVVK